MKSGGLKQASRLPNSAQSLVQIGKNTEPPIAIKNGASLRSIKNAIIIDA
jgi:hypothetical protein